ncbi:MAG: putative Na+/H+ antiporter [Betaproteobacteria bacterium]|nr:putative Na+/H+ antiporter [Betaproteobacteria bacterium]
MAEASVTEIVATALFALAILHTFASSYLAHLGARFPAHAGLWHLLGEVEVVFGLWAGALIVFMFVYAGREQTQFYVDGRHFTEPMFVFAVMVVAASRPITSSVRDGVRRLARWVAKPLTVEEPLALYFLTLAVIPLSGSLITEPAAMTLAALMLRDTFLSHTMPQRVKYATLGVLFVNVSIGGVLTPYAAPPVLMVANTWNWGLAFMLTTFGWRSVLVVLINAFIVSYLFREVLVKRAREPATDATPIPSLVRLIHFFFLVGIVYFSRHPAIFIPLLLFFLGFAAAYPQFQNKLLMLRESMLVAFFLGGLVVLGGMQTWWLQPLLSGMSPNLLFWGATALTAITDNAALTYLGSLVEGTDAAFHYSLVAGAIVGGGLTVIANAPNPAGVAILKSCFEDASVNPLKLFLAALGPTLVAALVFFIG